MYDSKLFSLIKELSRVQLTRLRDFVRSPYFNKHQKVMELFELIYTAHPHLSSAQLKKEVVFKKLFQGKKFNGTRLAHVMNYLQSTTEEFIAIEAFDEEVFLKNYLLTRQFKKMSSGKLFEQKIARMKSSSYNAAVGHPERSRRVARKPSRDGSTSLTTTARKGKFNVQQFYYDSLAENELDFFHLNRKKKTSANYLQQKTDSLDLFYLCAKLEHWCDMLNRTNVLNIEYEYPLLEDALRLIESNREKYLSVPWLNIYYHILLTLKNPEEQTNFHELKKLLLEYAEDFEKTDAKAMYDSAQNYCIKRINKGDSNYLKELLDLYKLMLEKELIYENGFFPPSDFKNIVTIACRLKEFDWTEKFIHRYKDKLEAQTREHVFQYNLASFYYEKSDYKNALQLLNTIEFTDTYFALGARSMLMKIYFELDETEPLFSHFDAFKIYLRRNKVVSTYQRRVHFNFIRFTQKVFQLKEAQSWKRKNELQKESVKLLGKIKSTSEITNRDWLEKQVKQISP